MKPKYKEFGMIAMTDLDPLRNQMVYGCGRGACKVERPWTTAKEGPCKCAGIAARLRKIADKLNPPTKKGKR